MHPRTIARTIALVSALAATGCLKEAASPTSAQRDQVTQEVLAAMKPMADAFARLDFEAALKLTLPGPDLALVMPDGKAYGTTELRAIGKEMAAGLEKQVFTPQQEKVIVLAPDAALYCWRGRIDMHQKDGVVMRAEPYSLTYLVRKVDGQWRFAFGHESGAAAQAVKP